jgi:DNA invertase Pin-like site-specific DNA recombinase
LDHYTPEQCSTDLHCENGDQKNRFLAPRLERTIAGLQARKAAGVKLGRQAGDYTDALVKANDLIAAGSSVRQAAQQVGISNSTLLRLINAA